MPGAGPPDPGQCSLLVGPGEGLVCSQRQARADSAEHRLWRAAAISAQVILAFVALGALFVKRLRETPQRPLEIWGMDVSKQVVSSLVAHVAGTHKLAQRLHSTAMPHPPPARTGMLIAIGIASRAVSQCAWYFCAFSVDTTLGVFVTVSLHQLLVRKAQQRTAEMWNKSESDSWVVSISECGSYGRARPALCLAVRQRLALTAQRLAGSPPRLARFWPQLIEFTACVVLARGVCALMVSS